MNTFFGFILLGISLSVPVGPINAAQLNKGIQFGFLHAWLVGLGAMFGDAIFMFLIYFGVAQFLTTPLMKFILYVLGFFMLVFMGIESIIDAKKFKIQKNTINGLSSKSFRTGFILAISNPINIIFWLGIYGAVLAKANDVYNTEQLLIYSSGIFLGIFLWDLIMASIASGFRKWMSAHSLQMLSMFAGLSLIIFGLYFGYEAYTIIFK